MNGKKIFFVAFIGFVLTLVTPFTSLGKEKEKEKSKSDFEIPSHVLNISKENTFPNSTEDQEIVEASEQTKELINQVDVPFDNPDLIKMLNETTIKPSFFAIGYRGMIYLGRWPINYKSLETNVNWEYQHINTNKLNNYSGESTQKINYIQEQKREVKGALTNKISNPDDVRKMMLLKAKEKTNLPLSYQTVIGKNTKKENSYAVPADKVGSLKAFAPAINEKGQVTFGEVYIKLEGNDKELVVKNVTKQGIGAWIPIQDYISFSFNLE